MKTEILLLIFLILCHGCICSSAKNEVRKFPEHFMFGAGTSSYQVEGAWNEDGKSESVWDRLVHSSPSPIADNSTGDVACDSYHLYKRDVEMMRELGLDYYRFSLSWPRILPNSFPNEINQAGVEYYNNLINEMLKYDIQPVVTLYHWDLPQKLQDLGGWSNPYTIIWFADYARIAFKLFGDRVKYWLTINEPLLICLSGYTYGSPSVIYSGEANYICAKNILFAHAKAFHIYDQEFRSEQNGFISIPNVGDWPEPVSADQAKAAEDSFQFYTGLYCHPIFSKDGGWPEVVEKTVASKSEEQGYPRSRLPPFTPEEKSYVQGTADFFGLNHYTTVYVYRNESTMNSHEKPSFDDDLGVGTAKNKMNTVSNDTLPTVPIRPSGMYKVLMKIKEEYDDPPVWIIENGYSATSLQDRSQVEYYQRYLDAVLDAIGDGSNVRAYTAWSLMDNFEWENGYTKRFGLYQVDYSSPQRTRTPRRSAFVYKEIVRSRALDPNYEPDTTDMTIDEGH